MTTLIAATAAIFFLAQDGRAPTRVGTEPLDAAREARVQTLGGKFRCAVCQGVSIRDSPASMARAQLDKVRELVAQGKGDLEVEDYFVDRYGEWALMEPRKSGAALWLWILPLLLLATGIVIIVRATRGAGGLEPVPPAPRPLTADLEKVRAELKE